jgi:tetratricopeptide (TPR) repeat protein
VNYPGNPSLAAPVKDRVISTFQQTLSLYKQGRRDEVIAGCGLILQMDPTFDPAKKLLEKTKNPALATDVDALIPGLSDTRPLMEQAREAMAGRDFQRVIHLTSELLSDDLMNDDARVLGDEAREKLEAAPFIDQFMRKSEANIKSGNYAAAKADLEKARALDASHPEVVRLTQALAARQSGPKPVPPQPSFVVDSAPPSTGRAASPASDFGFTFEEEKPHEGSFANFSFDSPADSPFSFGGAPAKAPGAEFDFSTASAGTSPDDQKKIEQYLADGDKAFASGDHQQAIDLWSRIFLIDVTNEQASERIEKAKGKRREIEQKVDALLASGLSAMERKDSARARAEFEEALRLDPGNANARGYLDDVSKPAGPAAAAAPSAPLVSDVDQKIDLDFFDDETPSGIEAPLIPPPPTAAAAAAAATSAKEAKKAKPVSAAAPRQLPTRAIAIVLAVLVLGGGGWFAYQKFNKSEDGTSATNSEALLGRAKALASLGKYDEAIKLLQDIKAGDAQHDAALKLMADLKQKQTGSAAFIDGKPAAQYYDEKVAAARAAFAQHDYAAAKTAFEEAQRVKPLAPDARAEYDTAANQVAQLDSAKKLFTEQRYDEAIASLQPILAQDPQNATAQRMILDAHFNLGAKALQEGRTAEAIAQFDEVLKVTPNDDLAKRSRELAQRYDKQGKDLLYQIYVKYLPLRQAT